MSNYNIKKEDFNKLNTVIVFDFKTDITDTLGNILPFPNSHYVDSFKYSYSWVIKGVFLTKKGTEYYNDLISRFLLTYKDCGVKHNKTYRTLKPTITELKHFQKLKSLTNSKMILRNRDNKEDFVFWCLKDYSESLIKEKGIVTYTDLIDFCYLHFQDYKKGFSTLKCKCRSIVNWYIDNDYRITEYVRKTKTQKEWEMTRSENMKNIKINEGLENRKKIIHFLSGMFIEEYKKPNGKWNYTKLSESLRMTRQTIKKHIEEIEGK